MIAKSILCYNSNIYYTVTGSGKTVMLLHGFAEDGTLWKHQVKDLEKSFRVIVVDTPGCGHSGIIADADIDVYAEVVKAIVDKELPAGQQLSMIGHSMGGYMTLAFAERYPSLLSSFGLFHSSAFADNEEKKATRRKGIDFIKANGGKAFIKTSTPNLFTKEYVSNHSAELNELIEMGYQCSDEALIQYYEAMMARPDRTSALKNCDLPILFLIGEQDQAIPLQSSLEQCYIPKQSHVHILKYSAHMGMWEETEKANSILIDFLSQ